MSNTSLKAAISLSYPDLKEACKGIVASKLIPVVRGRPGSGKTAMARDVAKYLVLKPIDVRLGNTEPVDLTGYPDLNKETGKATYRPFDTFPIEGDMLPILPEKQEEWDAKKDAIFAKLDTLTDPEERQAMMDKIEERYCYKGWLIIWDELPNADNSLQAAAFKILLEKEVGPYKLHSKVYQIGTGNNVEDNAAANDLNTAAQSRVIHLAIKDDPTVFQDYMSEQKFHPYIQAYLNWKPAMVNNFSGSLENSEFTYACERTWDFLNQLAQNSWNGDLQDVSTNPSKRAVICGTVGVSAGQDFAAFTSCFGATVTLEEVLKDPHGCMVPQREDIQIATAAMLAQAVTVDNCSDLLIYLSRLRKAYTFMAVRMMYQTNNKIITNPKISEFLRANRQRWIQGAKELA